MCTQFTEYQRFQAGCGEKLESYRMLDMAGVPVLDSVVLSNDEIINLDTVKEKVIIKKLNSDFCMIRYIYRHAHHLVKNGGKIVPINRQSLLNEREPDADLWLLEPSKRENNIYCCNISINKETENMHMEFLGQGFDISDINKGKVSPHEWIDIPYPIHFGEYGDWWKWARFHFCTHEEYKESVRTRKERLKQFGTETGVGLRDSFVPVGLEYLSCIFRWIQKIENSWGSRLPAFWNVSCSFENTGRVIFWDIQTPQGKKRAYWE